MNEGHAGAAAVVRRWRAVAATAALSGAVLVPLPDWEEFDRYTLWLRVLQDSGHVVVFAALATLALRVWPDAGPAAPHAAALRRGGVLAGALALGLFTEWLQRYIGRDASWSDLASDLAGTGIALLLDWRQACGGRPRRQRWALACALGLAVLASLPLAWATAAYARRQAAFPMLWSQSSWLDRFFVREDGARRRPGLVLREPWPDWRGYGSLQIEVSNPAAVPVSFGVRVSDLRHDETPGDRFNALYSLQAGEHRMLQVDLETVRRAPNGRDMDMAHIGSVVVLREAGHRGGPSPVVHSLALLRQPPGT